MEDDYHDTFGVPMRLVPYGNFTMGSDTYAPGAKPAHQVYLDTYYIDKFEVTNALYKACVDAMMCDPPNETNSDTPPLSYFDNSQYGNFPVIYVSWFQAKTYCEWRGAELPTEAQWEKAARGTDGRLYPWGDYFDGNFGNF